MRYEKISLIEGKDDVYLEVFVPERIGEFVRDALLVIPGGGYGSVCSNREGEPIALSFVAKGFAAFVLHYSVGEKAKFPQPLIEASLAVKYIKDHAKEYFINPDRVFACGFSAGGHLCASLGTMWHLPEVYEGAGIPYGSNKIKGMLPIYPVISGIVAGTHSASFRNILGKTEPTEEELKRYSLELRVDEHTVPAFLMHTAKDQSVSVANSLVFARALTDHGIRCELHIFPEGPHGVALANEITECDNPDWVNQNTAKWVDMAAAWMRDTL